MTFAIYSKAFQNGGSIPEQYTGEGRDISPPLEWSGAPPGTKSLVLIVDDPDAPDPKAPQRVYVHWLLYNLPAASQGLAEGIAGHHLPSGTLEGLNDWQETGYGGPAPPMGEHRYFFKLYALNDVLPDLSHPHKAEILKAMEGKVIAEAQWMGTYIKKENR